MSDDRDEASLEALEHEAQDDEEEAGMDHGERRVGMFVAGLAIGALVGAGLALLFAPQSGEETRRLVSRKAKHLAREARDRYDDVKEKVRRARREGHGGRGVDEAGAE